MGLAVLVMDAKKDEGKRERVSQATQLLKHLKQGDHFGEVALVADCVRTAWVRAETYVLLSALSRKAIEPIWQYFPEQKSELIAQVNSVKEQDKNRKAQAMWKKAGTHAKIQGNVNAVLGELHATATPRTDDMFSGLAQDP